MEEVEGVGNDKRDAAISWSMEEDIGRRAKDALLWTLTLVIWFF